MSPQTHGFFWGPRPPSRALLPFPPGVPRGVVPPPPAARSFLDCAWPRTGPRARARGSGPGARRPRSLGARRARGPGLGLGPTVGPGPGPGARTRAPGPGPWAARGTGPGSGRLQRRRFGVGLGTLRRRRFRPEGQVRKALAPESCPQGILLTPEHSSLRSLKC